jgi:hypothetical protein
VILPRWNVPSIGTVERSELRVRVGVRIRMRILVSTCNVHCNFNSSGACGALSECAG